MTFGPPRPSLRIRLDLRATGPVSEGVDKKHAPEVTTTSADNVGGVESHFIVRLPEDVARLLVQTQTPLVQRNPEDGDIVDTLHEESAEMTVAAECVSVQFVSARLAKVTVTLPSLLTMDNAMDTGPPDSDSALVLAGILLDLPTVVESLRTYDRSVYTKIADIHQVLECYRLPGLPSHAWDLSVAERLAAPFDLRGWKMDSGLTPPMHNVRQAVSHGGGRDKNIGLPQLTVDEIERIVEEMMARDASAASSTFTLTDRSTGRVLLSTGDGQRADPGDDGQSSVATGAMEEEEEEEEEEEDFGEDLTETETATGTLLDDDMDDDDFAAELEEELLADDLSNVPTPIDNSSSPVSTIASEARTTTTTATTTMDAALSVVSPSRQPLSQDGELQAKINERKAQLATLTNPLIRARMEDVIRQLELDLEQRRLSHSQQ